ncbi:Bacterial Ig-like domain (group 2) [Planctomycetes bacterium Pan216]|uniref:Bacterial Ig-like domain (Group 2) n=1 Tax=Kolteria novifilia TaxID=2527975 RepID=A0A518B546_9BACT|nr:Bacterial Ig-like domain (group 2) [Planctomycetes bacterium Pan216]
MNSKSVGILVALAGAALFLSSATRADAPKPAATTSRPDGIALLPAQVRLHGPRASQQLIVERVGGGRYVGQIGEGVTITSSNPKIVTIKEGRAFPVGDGTATLTASAGSHQATATVVVEKSGAPYDWSFRNHVQSVLTKTGCNSGACHGAQAGKKGFKLSLRGYDSEGDFDVITRQARGRRVSRTDPGRSLLLTKATATMPHGGGPRIEPGSLEYDVVSDWIAGGCIPPTEDDAEIERIEFVPPAAILQPKDKQQLVVLAHFSDGHVEDVTGWSKYTTANGDVATIDDEGLLTVTGNGEGAISAWYLNKLAKAAITSPYNNAIDDYVFENAIKRNFIDELVLDKLRQLQIPPSPRSSDDEFIRRLSIDLIGTLPTREETIAFINDDSPDKRDRLIDELLERPEFVDYWSMRLSDLLLVNSEKLKPEAMWAYYNWVRRQVARNTPWDEFVRQLVTAQGSTLENGAANFFVLHQDPLELTETVSVAFLGMSINCARCHNHPLEKWTNDQYFGMVNMMARVRRKNGPGTGNVIVFSDTRGDIIQPLTGKPQAPRPLDAKALDLDDPADRRIALANWLTSPENPHFAKSITNRVWSYLMGTGMVEKVDDVRLTNPASNEKLFAALADHFIEQDFDLKKLMRTIVQSQTYQRTSVPVTGNEGDDRFYSRYYPRRLLAEVIIDAISQVTDVPTQFKGYPASWRAIQLPDSNVPSYFLESFGRPNREVTSEDERSDAMGMVQILHITNGDTINKKLQAKGNRIDKLLASKKPMSEMIDDIFLAALSRQPTAKEREQLLAAYQESGKGQDRAFLEDLVWGVCSSKEFLFNH